MAARRAPDLYFAYGSNMNEAQMQSRVPGSRKVDVGWLLDHEFLYSGYSRTWGGAVANVRRKTGHAVFGVLYSLPPGGIDSLDRFEGYPHAYQRRRVTIQDSRGARRPALLYFKRSARAEVEPSPEYVRLITDAYRHHRGG